MVAHYEKVQCLTKCAEETDEGSPTCAYNLVDKCLNMTGISRSASHPSASGNTWSESNPRLSCKLFPKARTRKELLRTASNDSEMGSETEKVKTSKFGRLLRRSFSLMNTPSYSRSANHNPVTSSSSNSGSSQDIRSPTPISDNDSESETEGITNAFFFSTTPEDSSFLPTEPIVSEDKKPLERTTTRSVKVVSVHSQKSPHIRYAAGKLASGDYRSLPRHSKDYNQYKSTPRIMCGLNNGSNCSISQKDSNTVEGEWHGFTL